MLSKLLTLLVCLLFGLAFTAIGFSAGLLPLAEITSNAWSARSWQPVPGTVLESDREIGRRGVSTTTVRYRYEFAGKPYESERIGLARPGGDNLDRWQEEWHDRLQTAQGQAKPVTVWVDPARPHRAVLDRDIRWAAVVLHLPFALLFTAVGTGALYLFVRVFLSPDQAPAPLTRRSLRRLAHPITWIMAIFWCTLSWPMAALAWMGPHAWTPRFVVTAFASIGLLLLWAAFALRTSKD